MCVSASATPQGKLRAYLRHEASLGLTRANCADPCEATKTHSEAAAGRGPPLSLSPARSTCSSRAFLDTKAPDISRGPWKYLSLTLVFRLSASTLAPHAHAHAHTHVHVHAPCHATTRDPSGPLPMRPNCQCEIYWQRHQHLVKMKK